MTGLKLKNLTHRKLIIWVVSLVILLALSFLLFSRLWQNFADQYSITIGDIQFDLPAHLTLHDFQMSQPDDYEAKIGRLEIAWQWAPLLTGQVAISQLTVTNGSITVLGGSSDTAFEMPPVGISLHNASLNNVDFYMLSEEDSLQVRIPLLRLNSVQVKDTIMVDSLFVQEGNFRYTYFPDTTTVAEPSASPSLASIPNFNVNAINILNGEITLKNPEQNHAFTEIDLALNGWKNSDLLDFQMRKLAFTYQDTLALNFTMEEGAVANNLDTRLRDLSFAFPGLALELDEVYITNEEKLKGKVSLNNSSLSIGALKQLYPDILVVMDPELSNDSLISFGGNLSFDEGHLQIDSLSLTMLRDTQTLLSGIIDWSGDSTVFDFKFDKLRTLREDLYTFLLYQDYNEFYLWPSNIYGQASLQGNLDFYDIRSALSTNEGFLNIHSTVFYDTEENLFYDLEVESDSVQISQLVDYLPLDVPEGHLKLWMGGLLANDEVLDTFRMYISSKKFEVEQHLQENLKFSYFFNNQYDSIWGTLINDSIKADFRGAYYAADTSRVTFEGTVYDLAPQLLSVSLPLKKAQTQYRGSYDYFGDDYYQITLETDYSQLTTTREESITVPPARLVYQEDAGIIKTELLANEQQIFYLQTGIELPEFSTNNLAWLHELPETEAFLKLDVDSADFHQLTGYPGAVSVEGFHFQKAHNHWNFNLQMPNAQYYTYEINNLSFLIEADTASQNGLLTIERVNSPYLPLDSLLLEVSSRQDMYSIGVNSILGEVDKRLGFALDLYPSSEGYAVRIDEKKGFTLGEYVWEVWQDKGISFDTDFNIQSGNLTLQNENTQLKMATLYNGNLQFGIAGLNLSKLASAIDTTLMIEGMLKANLLYNPRSSAIEWEGEINQIKLNDLPVGDLTGDGTSIGDTLMANMELTDESTHAFVQVATKGSTYHYNSSLNNFDLGVLQSSPAWPEGYQLNGKIKGEVTGTYDSALTADGFLLFNEATFVPSEISTALHIPSDTVYLNNDELVLENFTIYDAVQNPLTLTGSVKIFPEVFMMIAVNSENFQVINDNNQKAFVKGNMELASDLNILGTPEDLAITGSLKFQPGNFVKYTYQGSTTLLDASKVVSFVDFSEIDKQPEILRKKPATNPIVWNVDVDIENSTLEILLNEVTQEFVRVTMGGQLRLREGPTNTPLMFGSLASIDGRALIFPPVIPDLDLSVEETTLQWNGEADKPLITFRGAETIKASPKGLSVFENRHELVSFKALVVLDQVTPDDIALKFDLESSDAEVNTYLKSLPPETREGYAIELLVFGSIGSQSKAEGSAILESATSKLNEIANRNLEKTDVTFGVDEREVNPGADDGNKQTNLNYKISRGLFKNKFFVSVGGDIGLYATGDADIPTSHLIGNVELIYILSERPSISLIGARKHVYEGVIDGDVVRTSMGITYKKSYPNLKSIFRKKDKSSDK